MKANCRGLFFVLALIACFQSVSGFAAGFQLSLKPSGRNVVLSWPVTGSNWVLQSSVSLAAPIWQTVANPAPVILNNTNTVTYTNDSATRYFRLYLSPGGFYLAITPGGKTVILSWPVAATNFVLQSTVNLSPASWQTITFPTAVPINGTNFLTYTNDSATRFFRLYANTNTPSVTAGMVQIPAGTFTMGDVTDTNINGDAAPVSVTVSAFYMDTNLVSYAQWQAIYNWAVSAGYNFHNGGADKAANHPVQNVDWFDAVKWCNARSQQAGLTPVYYPDAGFTQAYTNDSYYLETNTIYANWSANGFRLPTEAEWERAARGGLSGQRFPWGNQIDQYHADYFGDPASMPGGYFYDNAPYYYNSAYYYPPQPYTAPVGSFPPNAYGLFDMAGNVMEWCWDLYATPYTGGTNPNGPAPASGGQRVLRGGDWGDDASWARCAARYHAGPTFAILNSYGFRCVKAH